MEGRGIPDKAEVPELDSREIEKIIARRAQERAEVVRWNRDIIVSLFAVLIIVVILLFQRVVIEIVALVAFFGLAMVWLVRRRWRKQLYQRFYDEELSKLRHTLEEREGETIEEMIQKALRERMTNQD